MRTLPAQFTDIATQLAGGQNPWLILLQQGGQVKDSFGGMIPMFRGLAGAITLPMVGSPRWRWRQVRWRTPGTRGIPRFQRLIKPWFFPVIS
ncbi:tail fiber component H, partial [Escherichia coli DEC11A]